MINIFILVKISLFKLYIIWYTVMLKLQSSVFMNKFASISKKLKNLLQNFRRLEQRLLIIKNHKGILNISLIKLASIIYNSVGIRLSTFEASKRPPITSLDINYTVHYSNCWTVIKTSKNP